MTKFPLSAQLNQRVLLWKRVRQETSEGDLIDHWSPIARVWAKIRIQKWSNRDTHSRDQLEITMRSNHYQFHGIQWNGKYYKVTSPLLKDPECHTWRFYGKNVTGFNQI